MKKIYNFFGLAFLVNFGFAQVVINEVYGGGGNAGSLYKADFIELYNVGITSINLSGLFLWYTGATGNFSANQALPSFDLAPGQYYLVQQNIGTGGTTDLPTPDFVPTNPFNMSATSFKVALTNTSTAPTSATDVNIVDFVGAGTANLYEGSATAPAGTNTSSITRNMGIDTNNNSLDFTLSNPPTPKAANAVLRTHESKATGPNIAVLDGNELLLGVTGIFSLLNTNGQLVKTFQAKAGSRVDVSQLALGVYIIQTNTGKAVETQKIIKK